MLKKIFKYIQNRTAERGKNSKIYIVPTLIGLYFFSTAILQLIMGVVFSNNLILLFGLMLLIFGILTAVITNFHLENLEIVDLNIQSGHQNAFITYSITVKNLLSKHLISGINFKLYTKDKDQIGEVFTSLRPSVQNIVGEIKLPRGQYEAYVLIISTNFPLNLFKSWKVNRFKNKSFFIYPKRVKQVPLIKHTVEAEQSIGDLKLSAEFSHIDKYIIGEPKNRIDWKVFARTGELYKKVFQEPISPQEKYFLKHPLSEKKLSEVSSLISNAKEKGSSWELEFENKVFSMNTGNAHYKNCQSYLSTLEINEKST